MSAAALKQQAFSRRAWRDSDQALDEAGGYFPHPDQVELFHDAPLVAVEPVGDSPDEFHSDDAREDAGESFGEDSVSSAQRLRSASHRISRDAQDRNLQPVLDQKFPRADRGPRGANDGAPIDTIGTHEFTEICGDALFAAFGRMSAPIQRIAQVANVNERTAKNWWEKKCAPSGVPMLRLMAHVSEFQGAMRQLAAMERDIDPDFERALAETIRLAQRHGFGGGR